MDLRSRQINENPKSYIENESRKKNRSIRIYDIVLGLLMVIAATVFFGVMAARSENGGWILPLVVFSVYCTTFLIFALTGANRKTIFAFLLISMLTSAVFTHTMWHFLWILVAGMCAFRGVWQIRRQLFGSTKINVLHAANTGIVSFLLGVSILLSSQHYQIISDLKPSDVVNSVVQSQVRSMKLLSTIILKVKGEQLGTTNSLEGTTIDDFLRSTLVSESDISPDDSEPSGSPSDIPEVKKSFKAAALLENAAASVGIDPTLLRSEIQKNSKLFVESSQSQIVEAMRNQLSDKIGLKLEGSESLFSIITQATALKVQDLINENPALTFFLPLLLSIFFFLAIFSIGSLLRFLWTLTAAFIFWMLRTYGFIKIIKVQKVIDAIKY